MSRTVSAVASDRQTPYLRHGVQVDGATDVRQALSKAGLDWEVEKVPAYDLQHGKPVKVQDRFNIRRKDTLEVFDVVGSAYQEVSNIEALGFGDDLAEVGGAKFVAAGTTRKGKGVWLAFELPETISFGGQDPHGLTGLLETTHDGKRAVRMHIAPIRFACTNVMNLMVRNAVQRFAIAHTGLAPERLREAALAVGLVENYCEAYEAMGHELLGKQMSDKELDSFLEVLLPPRPKRDEEKSAIKALAAGPTNEFGRGTAYASLNAVREYYDHVRPQRTTESSFIGAYTGVNQRMTQQALTLLQG